MDDLYGKDQISDEVGERKYGQKNNQRQQEILGQMKSQVMQYRMANPGLPLLGWVASHNFTIHQLVNKWS